MSRSDGLSPRHIVLFPSLGFFAVIFFVPSKAQCTFYDLPPKEELSSPVFPILATSSRPFDPRPLRSGSLYHRPFG